jgi:DNA-binding SARP family transcriptional activator/TolB-like protein
MIALKLFGGASIESDGSALNGPAAQRHRIALLALIAAAHARGITREKAMAHVWPERDAEHARKLLNQALHVLRKALGDAAIVSSGDALRLDQTVIQCDVVAFEEALTVGDRERAIGLYSGPFLDGFFLSDAPEFERWLDAERERFHQRWRQALTELADERASAGDHAGAADHWRRLLADDPYDARTTVRLMQTLELSGDRAGALRQARQHVVLMEQDFDAEPNPEIVALAERIRATPTPVDAAAPSPARAQANVEPLAPVETDVEDRSSASQAVSPERTRSLGTAKRYRWRWIAASISVLLVLGFAYVSNFSSRSRAPIRRIAVLPLANLTGDPAQEYFVAGMHAALIDELAKIEALTVYSRQSVLRYQGSNLSLPAIARELGVDALVEGSVFKSGDSVRISTQVVRAEPEEHLVASVHQGPLDQALALQGTVARDIAEGIRTRVAPDVLGRMARARAVNPDAQEAYLAGLYHIERASYGDKPPEAERGADHVTAIRYLEQAVRIDSTWAAAYGKLALAYHWRASSTAEPSAAVELYSKSKAAAERALALDETDSQAHASLGFVLFYYQWEWGPAEREIRRAMELDPNSHHWIYALYLQAAGRHEEAIDHFRLAMERNPLSEILSAEVAQAYACAGRHDEAIAHARALLTRVERSGRVDAIKDRTVWMLDLVSRELSMKGSHDEAIRTAEQLLTLSPDTSSALARLAFAQALGGRRGPAKELLARLEKLPQVRREPRRVANVYAALGDVDRALEIEEAAYPVTRYELALYRCSDVYELLRDEPRMQEFVRPIGFPT